jgi:hypothetical protein
MTSMLQSSTQTRRTNSLGRAKSPCQDCQRSELPCDRARPRCFTCISNGIACKGYKMDLRWQLGVASKGNLAGFSHTAPTAVTASLDFQDQNVSEKRRWRGKTSKATGDRHFRFVEGKSADKPDRKAKTAPKSKLAPSKSGTARRREEKTDLQHDFESPDANQVVVDAHSDCSEKIFFFRFFILLTISLVNTLNESTETFSLNHSQTCSDYEVFDTPRIYPEEDTNEEASDANTCRAIGSLG